MRTHAGQLESYWDEEEEYYYEEPMEKPGLFLMLTAIATVATFPLYVFPSGYPQPSHGFFLLFCLCFHRQLLVKILPDHDSLAFKPVRAAVCFVLVVIGVQVSYALTLPSTSMLKGVAFFTFNFVYMVILYRYLVTYRRTALNHVFIGILLATSLAAAGVLLNINPSGSRETGFFNNPNQLGYFGLIVVLVCLSCYSLCSLKLARLMALFGITTAAYLILVSLSKAAMVSAFFGVIIFAPSIRRRDLFYLLILSLICLPFAAPKVIESDVISRVVARVQNIGKDSDDSIAGRGYNRIRRYPEKMILGAGEGEYRRFGARLEMHSTIGSIVFCYGIAGAFFFFLFNYRCFRISPVLYLSLFSPIYAYGLTHNGIRFSAFWLAYAVFLAVSELRREDAEAYTIESWSMNRVRSLIGLRTEEREPGFYALERSSNVSDSVAGAHANSVVSPQTAPL
ncbi:MAG: hypothetical protein AAFV88_16300 [Planctomycetota bacterium]